MQPRAFTLANLRRIITVKVKYPLLRPTLDVVFKMLFARRRGRSALISLLNEILKPKSKITTVEVLNPDIPKILVGDKGTVLDIHAKLADGTLLDIEMQMASHDALAKRALYYGSRMYSSELKKGHYYTELRPVIVIFLVAEDIFPSRPSDFEVSFSLQQDDTGAAVFAELREQMQIKFFEISKAFRLWQERQLPLNDVSLGAWLGFLADPSSQAVEEACMSIPELKDAKNALEELSAQDEAREIARVREKSRIHFDSLMAEATAKGKAEGRAEGEAKGLNDKAKSVLKALLSAPETKSLPNARLAELTGLSVEVIAKVRAE